MLKWVALDLGFNSQDVINLKSGFVVEISLHVVISHHNSKKDFDDKNSMNNTLKAYVLGLLSGAPQI